MSLIDAIGDAVCRVANEIGYALAIAFGAVSTRVPEEIELAPDNKELESMVAEAAYYRAGQRGFTAGDDLGDWLEAEKEIMARFNVN